VVDLRDGEEGLMGLVVGLGRNRIRMLLREFLLLRLGGLLLRSELCLVYTSPIWHLKY